MTKSKYEHLEKKVKQDAQNKPLKSSQRRVTEERVVGKRERVN